MMNSIPALECDVTLRGAKDPDTKFVIDIDPSLGSYIKLLIYCSMTINAYSPFQLISHHKQQVREMVFILFYVFNEGHCYSSLL